MSDDYGKRFVFGVEDDGDGMGPYEICIQDRDTGAFVETGMAFRTGDAAGAVMRDLNDVLVRHGITDAQ